MQRRTTAAVLTVVAVGVLAGAGDAPAAKRKAKPCAAGKIAQTVNGKRRCVPASRFRVRATTPESEATGVARRMLARIAPVRARRPRQAPRPIPAALQRLAVTGFAAFEQQLLALARGPGASSAAANRVTSTAGRSALPAPRARAAADAAPTVSTNGDGSVTARGSKTFTSGGSSLKLDLGVTAQRDGTWGLDVGFTYDDAQNQGTNTTLRFAMKQLGDPNPSCPSPTGVVKLGDVYSGTVNKEERYGSDRVKLGTIRWAAKLDSKVTATAQMSTDATLQPFAFTISSTYEFNYGLQGLAFFRRQASAKATASMSGTIDPATGTITGGEVTSTTQARDDNAEGVAGLRTTAQSAAEKSVREASARMLREAKRVEEAARSGACTRLVLTPPSASLDPGASTSVGARLVTRERVQQPVPTVSWSATPGPGRVAPGSSKEAEPSFTVTGEPPGPTTASVAFRAVSPAGISQETWTGTGGEPSKLRVSATGTFSGTDDDVDGSVSGTLDLELVKRAGESGNYDLPAATAWSGLTQSITPHSPCIIAGTSPISVFPQPANTGAVRRDGVVTVFLIPGLAAGYVLTVPDPSGACAKSAGPRAVAVTVAAAPGLSVAVRPGTPTRVTGGSGPNAYDVTVNVTEVP